jgi:hypothetical protein
MGVLLVVIFGEKQQSTEWPARNDELFDAVLAALDRRLVVVHKPFVQNVKRVLALRLQRNKNVGWRSQCM